MKIPFERTISGAYRFAFANILSLIGIAWFPYLLLAALVGGVGYGLWPQLVHVFDAMKEAKPGQPPDFEQIRPLFALMGSFYGLILPAFVVATAMVTVGMMRKAL